MNRKLSELCTSPVVSTGLGAQREDVKRLEEFVGFELPEDYKYFLSVYGCLKYDSRIILGISDEIYEDSLETMCSLLDHVGTFPRDVVIIENVGFDNLFVIMDKQGHIYQYDLSEKQLLYHSFDEFMLYDVFEIDAEEDVKRYLTGICELIYDSKIYTPGDFDLQKRLEVLYFPILKSAVCDQISDIDRLCAEICMAEQLLSPIVKLEYADISRYSLTDCLRNYYDLFIVIYQGGLTVLYERIVLYLSEFTDLTKNELIEFDKIKFTFFNGGSINGFF